MKYKYTIPILILFTILSSVIYIDFFKFKDNYIILPFNEELIEQITKSPEVEENYLTKPQEIELFPGVEGTDGIMKVFYPDPNKAILRAKQGKETKPFLIPSDMVDIMIF